MPAGAAEQPALSREEIDRLLLARADRAIFGQPGEPAAALPTTLFTPPPAAPPPRPPDRRAAAGATAGDGGEEDAAGPLEVTIGRLEVVAPPPPPEPRPRPRVTPRTSLDDYLQGRRVGG